MRLKLLLSILGGLTALGIGILTYFLSAEDSWGTFDPSKYQEPPNLNVAYIPDEKHPLKQPLAAALDDDGTLYVSDPGNIKIAFFNSKGKYKGNWDLTQHGIEFPYGIAVHKDKVYIADPQVQDIFVFDRKGNFKTKFFVDKKDEQYKGIAPAGLAIDKKGNLYVADVANHRVIVFDSTGVLSRTVGRGGIGPEELSYPNDIALDSQGNIYVADSNNSRVQKYSSEGEYLLTIDGKTSDGQGGFSLPRGIEVDSLQRLWVVDTFLHKVLVFDINGKELFSMGSRGEEKFQLNFPNGIAIDNEKGRIFIADRENYRIQAFGYGGGK